MKIEKLTITLLILCFFCSCASERENFDSMDFGAFKIIKKEVPTISALGKIKKAIKLETIDDSVLGTIYRIVRDKKSGDVLLGDYDSRKKVFRFSQEGKFLLSYGKTGEGPGEFGRLIGFALNNNGDVYILSPNKIIKYSKDGKLERETRIDFYASSIEVVNDLIYVSITRYYKNPKDKSAILILNPLLKKIGTIGKYDTRLEKYNFSSPRTITKNDNYFYFTDYYDLSIIRYKLSTKKLSRLIIPNDNSSLDSTWKKKNFVESDRTEIKNKIHNFTTILGFKENLLLFERCKEKKYFNAWIMNFQKKEALVFSITGLFGGFNPKQNKSLFFNAVVGAWEKGVICVFNNVEEFNSHKQNYALLKDIQFKADDNPILAFFEFQK